LEGGKMAMIKCSECGKDISDKASVCIGCGAPILSASSDTGSVSIDALSGDANSVGKINHEDSNLESAKKIASDKVGSAIKFGREKIQSAMEKLANGEEPYKPTPSEINRDKFKAALESTIDAKFADIMRSKQGAEVYMTYVDAQILTASVRNVFKGLLQVNPPQVETALMLAEAVLAPSTKEKSNLIKAAVGVGGGTAGIGIVIGSIGAALGWGAGVVASVGAFFTTSSMAGPIGWGVAGLSIAAIAGYFATTSSNQTDTERFVKVVKASTAKAVDTIWLQYETELSKIIT